MKRGFISGLIVGALTMTTVSVMANNLNIQALLVNNATIFVDGKIVDTKDYSVLNYKSSVYTPVRLIAESLGADVGYEKSTNTIFIKSPEPEVEYVEVPVEVRVEVPVEVPAEDAEKEEVEKDNKYSYPPVSSNNMGLAVRVENAFNTTAERCNVTLTVENTNKVGFTRILYNKIYMENENGREFKVNSSLEHELLASIPEQSKLEDVKLTFSKYVGETGELHLPVVYTRTPNSAEEKGEVVIKFSINNAYTID
ncbi:MAG: stalk domain-containing protein [Lachnospirales bacterium]